MPPLLTSTGEGAFSQVFLVRRISDSQEYALKKVSPHINSTQVKMMNLSEKEKQNALNEVRLLASIDDPNVIAYKEAFIDDNQLCLVMEHADGGDLLSKVTEHAKRGTLFKETEIWNYLAQMISGLKALHSKNVYHRDIKCANIFVNRQGIIKLGDFNVSKVIHRGGLAYTQTGTPYYASPEVWKDKPYDWRSDIWSLGCVIYELCALKPPFRAADMKGLYRKVVYGEYLPIPQLYSGELGSVIRSMLQVNHKLRPSCEELLSAHQVIKNVNDKNVMDILR